MNTEVKPKNWNSAASLVLDSAFDLAKSQAVADFPDLETCFDAMLAEFDDAVENAFSKSPDTELLEEQMFCIASYAMHGYASSSEIHTRRAVTEIFNTLIAKQKMYGHGNIARFGMPGILIRLNDKMERLKNLQHYEGPVLFEPIKDTWLDIVGYSVIAVMWNRDWFLLNLKKTSESTSHS
jgi:hypothetical protein